MISVECCHVRELRAELEGRGHIFVGRSDTEVLLHAYAEWGEACAERRRADAAALSQVWMETTSVRSGEVMGDN